MKHIIKYMLIPAVALLLSFMITNWIYKTFLQKETAETVSSGVVQIGGPFTLTNQYGAEVTNEDFKGSLMLVYFGFTNCPMICPADMANMTAALQELGDDANEITPVFITIDPARDDIEQVKSFADNFYPTLQALTGTPEQIAQVANAYKVYYKQVKSEELGDYLMDHSAYMYLMDRDGKYITHFRHDQPSTEIAAGLKKYL